MKTISNRRQAVESSPGDWGTWGAVWMKRYAQPVRPQSRRRCRCGCTRRATHLAMANGLALMSGCEFSVARWVKRPE